MPNYLGIKYRRDKVEMAATKLSLTNTRSTRSCSRTYAEESMEACPEGASAPL